MLKIGMTGGIASGKSTVCQLFAAYHSTIIDADLIAKQLVEPGKAAYQEIIALFGQQIVLTNGELDRRQLRQRIFADLSAKQQLEAILHPRIRKQLQQQSSQQATQPYLIMVIPLLIEANMLDLVDRVLVIDINPEQQRERLQQRDQHTKQEAQWIINQQCDPQLRLQHADDIIDNNDSQLALAEQVAVLHHQYCQLSLASC